MNYSEIYALEQSLNFDILADGIVGSMQFMNSSLVQIGNLRSGLTYAYTNEYLSSQKSYFYGIQILPGPIKFIKKAYGYPNYLYAMKDANSLNFLRTVNSSTSGFDIYWDNRNLPKSSVKKYTVWKVDAGFSYVSELFVGYSRIFEVERTQNYDILKDGKIGVQIQNITSIIGSVQFGKTDTTDRLYGIKNGSSLISFIRFESGDFLNSDYVRINGGLYRAVGAVQPSRLLPVYGIYESFDIYLTNGTHHHYLYVSAYKYTGLNDFDDFSNVDDLLVFDTYSLSNAEFLQAELTYNYDFSGNGKKGLELKVKLYFKSCIHSF
jgi:hypothetical protein